MKVIHMLAQDKKKIKIKTLNKKESHANLLTNDFATMVILSQLYLFIFYLFTKNK
jgi:hypothetical protein